MRTKYMALLDYLPLHIQAGFSFASDWFYNNCGTPWDEATMRDPVQRQAMQEKQAHFIRQKYPAFFGQDAPEIHPRPSLGIGVATLPSLFGCPVRFTPHMNPIALPLIDPATDPMTLKPPNLDNMLQWLYHEVDVYVDAGWKKQEIGLPDLQGPLNIAMRVIGDKRMLGLIARKSQGEVVRHVLAITSDAFIDVYRALRKATNKPLVSNLTIAGCSYMYLGPSHWTEFCLPVVKKCEVLGNIGLHHCGEASSEKIEAYAHYPWTSVELGFGSDLKRARQLFIHPKLGPVPFSCRVSPYRMLNQPAEQIRKDVEWICENAKGGPVSINVVGVPLGTPVENLWVMYNAVQAYNKQKEAEIESE